jgi:hypothetical protein
VPSLGDRLRVLCPVSSPALAQLWFEFHAVGGRVARTTAMLMLVIVVSLLARRRASAEVLVPWLWIALVLPMWLTASALLGLKRKHGHTRLDVFAGARPIGTARLVALKVLAGSLVLFAAWAAVGAGLWIFQRWVAGPELDLWAIIVDYFYLVEMGFVDSRPGISPRVPGVAVTLAIQVIAIMAGAAALQALFVLYAKRIMLAALAVMLYTVLIVTMVMRGWIPGDLITVVHVGALAAAVVIGMSFVLWRGRAEGVFSAFGVAFIVATGLAFAIAAIAANIAWINPGGNSIGDWLAGFMVGLLPLSAMVLTPWSFSRLRHQ